jgi:hydroxymethylbilane synthase
MPHDCHFCRQFTALSRLPPSEVVWQFPHSIAFLGRWQFYQGYCVLVSRTHATELSALDDAERRAYLDEMCVLSRAIEAAFRPHKLNYELLGNQVPHLHWHLFPRAADDPDRMRSVWLTLDRAEHDAETLRKLETGPRERAAISALLREQLTRLKAPHRMSAADAPPSVRVGTRGSALAVWQANHVAEKLRAVAAPRSVQLVEVQTTGDFVQHLSLSQIGGDGVFTRELQRALLDRRVDLAVHSLKDLPTSPVEGLTLAAVPPRGPTGDAFVSRKHARFDELPKGATVGTSSVRRRAQLLHRRPDLHLVPIRGNVDTRLRKLADLNFDAIILAEAGLVRLGLADAITEVLDPSWMLPAVGQGALGVECRADDAVTLALLRPLDDAAARAAVLAERALLRALGGGCQVPIGALATVEGERLTLRGAVLSPDGREWVGEEIAGAAGEAEALGAQLAARLRERGADRLLAAEHK